MSKKYKASNWVPNYPMYAIKRNINVVIPIRLQYTKFINLVRVTEEQLKRIFHPVSITQCRVPTSMCAIVQASINTCKNNPYYFTYYENFNNMLKCYKQCRAFARSEYKRYELDDFYRNDFPIFFKRMKFLEKILDMADKGRITPDVLR
jgi:hypothetical protein